jgi:hypothetical protein
MADAPHTPPPPLFPADTEHPLVAALSIFIPGTGHTAERPESDPEGEADLFAAMARHFAHLGPT